MRRTEAILGVIILLTFCAASLIAQTHLGMITGRVADSSGAVVPGAAVVLTNKATGTVDKVQTNTEGLYTFGNVAAAQYEISVVKEGFDKTAKLVTVEVAQRLGIDFTLTIGKVSEQVEVTSAVTGVNTVSSEVGREITSRELDNMPLLTRNPYVLVALAPGAVDASAATGDAQGLGIAVAGARTRSINFLLDGSENNETFAAGPSTLVPADAMQEFKVQTNSMTAEFGRNALQANVITKSGSNELHGSAYEYYRGSALSSQPVEEKVNGIQKGRYVRNVFGGSLGGPIVKNKTFFFGALEGTRVRSVGRQFYYVPTTDFFNAASGNMQQYLQAGGGLPKPLLGQALTAADIVAAEQDVSTSAYGTTPGLTLFAANGAPIAGNTPLWQRTFTSVPIDAGGGVAQNAWSATTRIDHQLSTKTQLMGRWAWFRQILPVGASSDSPYPLFQTDYSFRSQNGSLTLTRTFTDLLFNESRFTFSRTMPNSPLGKGSVNVQCLQYGLSGSLGTSDQMVFPGYLPASCTGYAIPSGGPQNTYAGYTGFTYSKGKHILKWGAYARHLRDNHTFGASANAAAVSSTMQNLINGQIDSLFSLAIDPKGHVPGETYDVAVDGPLGPPSFTRHYRYNEFAFYGEDQLKLTPRVTLTAGLRWEYFGVLHSPNAEKYLDANLYLNMVGIASGNKDLYQQVRDARFARTNNFFRQDFNNFAPRIGLAWNVTGSGRTVVRGGYGMFYDANFGNALFNAIQNPPNYAVVNFFGDGVTPMGPVQPNQFDSLAALAGGGPFAIVSSARMLDRDMVTAFSHQWNATFEHDVLGKGLLASVGYVGAKGEKLYSLNNLNQRGSCIMLGDQWCNGNPLARLNQTGLTGMNRRSNEGFSRYDSLQLQLRSREIGHTGLQLTTNYTYAHSTDNSSSFFNDSAFDYNGNLGFSQPYNPAADKADSSNDIRHRFTANYSWTVPWTKNLKGASGHLLGGWTLTGILAAQTGGAFSVYEDNFGVYSDVCSLSSGNACYPVVTGAAPGQSGGYAGPNRSVLYNFDNSLTSLEEYCHGDLACSQGLYYFQPNGLFLKRNTFRTPGIWNFDAAVLKDIKLKEGMKLQARAEFFNLFNHSNLYADPNTNVLSAGQVLARRGVLPSHELYGVSNERRNIQLAVRLIF